MTPTKVPVSVLVPIKNEAQNLPRCLQAIAWAEQIVVVDSQSTDASIEIARQHGAEVVQFQFNGVWPKKKNWALENVPFRHEWVFILDADEVMPDSAASEFAAIIAQAGAGKTGYWINRRFMFMGDWLRHSYYPNWNLRLFKHRSGRYEQLVRGETDSGDNEVHEHIVVQGETGRLRCEMDHYAFPTIATFIEKHNRYSNWEAKLAVEKGLDATAPTLQMSQVSVRRTIKRWVRILPFRPFLRFAYVYFVQLGFLDGTRGYYFARLHGIYEFLSIAKTAELRGKLNANKASKA
jgi:glycosyltransferase involved in cell wall biosynthesis